MGVTKYQVARPLADVQEGYQNQLVALGRPNYDPVGWQEFQVKRSRIHAMDDAVGEVGKPGEGLM